MNCDRGYEIVFLALPLIIFRWEPAVSDVSLHDEDETMQQLAADTRSECIRSRPFYSREYRRFPAFFTPGSIVDCPKRRRHAEALRRCRLAGGSAT